MTDAKKAGLDGYVRLLPGLTLDGSAADPAVPPPDRP